MQIKETFVKTIHYTYMWSPSFKLPLNLNRWQNQTVSCDANFRVSSLTFDAWKKHKRRKSYYGISELFSECTLERKRLYFIE